MHIMYIVCICCLQWLIEVGFTYWPHFIILTSCTCIYICIYIYIYIFNYYYIVEGSRHTKTCCLIKMNVSYDLAVACIYYVHENVFVMYRRDNFLIECIFADSPSLLLKKSFVVSSSASLSRFQWLRLHSGIGGAKSTAGRFELWTMLWLAPSTWLSRVENELPFLVKWKVDFSRVTNLYSAGNNAS